ncbi:hypothetical protein Poly41_29980 [Novipirellula artificiosorum]|uniref:Uncharacterized protein n=1 Tax=Novipirellula artificiosorum TaxID=2528016 RepID=A0A5C6DSQ4_9BACT|nr:hypothetical protein Poly41_29980 [Novipirellula artificiosorum]
MASVGFHAGQFAFDSLERGVREDAGVPGPADRLDIARPDDVLDAMNFGLQPPGDFADGQKQRWLQHRFPRFLPKLHAVSRGHERIRRKREVTKVWGPKTAADQYPNGVTRQSQKRLVGVGPIERWLSRWSGWSLDG